MHVDQMRADICDVYPNSTWERKVADMPDYQVVAIYYSFVRSGKFDKKPSKPATTPKKPIFEPKVGHHGPCDYGVQLSFYDLFMK